LLIGKDLSLLLSIGISVCGASAIAVLSPLIGAKKEETSLSIISVMFVGLLGLILYSLIIPSLGLSSRGSAFLVGTTLPMLGQVKVIGRMVGEDVLTKAVNYKLMRVSLLVFLIIWFGLVRKDDRRGEGLVYLPYITRLILVAGFILMVCITNLSMIPGLQRSIEPLSRFFLTMTLSSIGLSVDFDSIAEIGPGPLYAILISWFITVAIVYIIALYYV